MRWLSGERFLLTLQDAAPTGVRDADPAYWVLRLDALRLANRPDQFDEAAIDYCVTYEVSPPSWERTRCQVRIGGSGLSTQSPPLSQVGEVATSFLESSVDEHSGAVTMASVELSGQLVGDIGATFRQLDTQLAAAPLVTVSCAKLIRVDFIAAGDLLNWVLSKRGESRSVTFAEAHRLVALFFGAMGINEHASAGARQRDLSRTGRRACLERPQRRPQVAPHHGTQPQLSRHHHPQRAAQRRGGHWRRWPGHSGQYRRQGQCAQGSQAAPRHRAGRLRRRHGRCLHAVRALRGQAGEAPGPSGPGRDRADTRLAHRPRAASARGDARRGRQGGLADHHRQRRRARARVRHRGHRLGWRLRPGGRARAARPQRAAAPEIVKRSLEIAGDICIYTNQQHTIEVLDERRTAAEGARSLGGPRPWGTNDSVDDAAGDRLRTRPPHRRPERRQARRRDCAAQPLAAPAGRREDARRDHAEEHPDDRPDRRGQDGDCAPPGALADAPFIKVEATKFTEVGYVGKDVDSIVRDLVDVAVKQERERQMRGKRALAEGRAQKSACSTS